MSTPPFSNYWPNQEATASTTVPGDGRYINTEQGNFYIYGAEFKDLNGNGQDGRALYIHHNTGYVALVLCYFNNINSNKKAGAIRLDETNCVIDSTVANKCYTTNTDEANFQNQGQFVYADGNGISKFTKTSITECAPSDVAFSGNCQRPLALTGTVYFNTVNISQCYTTWCSGFYTSGTISEAKYINVEGTSSNMVAIELASAGTPAFEYTFFKDYSESCATTNNGDCGLALLYFYSTQATFNYISIQSPKAPAEQYLIFKAKDEAATCTFNNYVLFEGAKTDGITLSGTTDTFANTDQYITEEKRQAILNPSNPDPGNETVDPGNETVDPGNETVDPGNETVDPGNETVDPGNETVDPGNETVDPGNETVDPGNETVDPGNETVDPGNETVDPGNETVNPGNETVNPDPENPQPEQPETPVQTPAPTNSSSPEEKPVPNKADNQENKIARMEKKNFYIMIGVIIAAVLIIIIIVIVVVVRLKKQPHDVTSSSSESEVHAADIATISAPDTNFPTETAQTNVTWTTNNQYETDPFKPEFEKSESTSDIIESNVL